MATSLEACRMDDGNIKDQYGSTILAPSQFYKDLPRNVTFHINGQHFYHSTDPNSNPNEVSRELYRTYGRKGAERVMHLCNQSWAAELYKKSISRIGAEGEWGQKFPGKTLFFPCNKSGMVFNVTKDKKTAHVTISIKQLMQINVGDLKDPNKDFASYYVVKEEVQIPFTELTAENFEELENPAPGLQVKEMVSSLVVNNLAEAQELFAKTAL